MIGGPQRQGRHRQGRIGRTRGGIGAGTQHQQIPILMMDEVSINDARRGVISHDDGALDVRGRRSQRRTDDALDGERFRQLVDHLGNAVSRLLGIFGIILEMHVRDRRVPGTDR